MHRGGAGVVGMAGELEIEARLAHDAGDGRDAEVFGLEYRALLNVNFDEADCVLVGNGCFEIVGVEAEVFDCLPDS